MFYTTQENRYHSNRYSGNRMSPAAVTGAIAIHAIVISAAILMPPEMVPRLTTHVFPIKNIPLSTPDPEPLPQKTIKKVDGSQNQRAVKPTSENTQTKPVISPGDDDGWIHAGNGGGVIKADPLPIDPPRTPIFVNAGFDQKHMRDVQPPYPGSMVRQQIEGTVTVRVHITPLGSVDRVDRINATTDEFWEATRKQALSRWRFRPATLDGIAVESERVMTVHFRLT